MEQALPQNDAAERATLGAVLLNRDAIVPISQFLHPWHFYTEKHAWVWEAQHACYMRREPPDVVNVAEELRAHGRLEPIGGVPYLMDLSNAVPTAYHVEYYAKTVWKLAILRRLIQAGGRIASLGYEDVPDPETLEQVIAEAGHELQQVFTASAPKSKLFTMTQLADEWMERYGQPSRRGMPTGVRQYDLLTGGLHKTDLVICAGRPAMGKTGWMLEIADNMTRPDRTSLPVDPKTDAGPYRVVIVSLEMGRWQLFDRLLARRSLINLTDIRLGRFGSEAAEAEALTKLVSAAGELTAGELLITDPDTVTVAGLQALLQMHIQTVGPIDVVMVDYLTLLAGTGFENRSRADEVGAMARGLKAMAKALDLNVFVCAQLSRECEYRANKRPIMPDLRESGEIEQAADLIMGLYRDGYYDEECETPNRLEVIILKHRNGPLDTLYLDWDGETQRYIDPLDHAEADA